MLVTGENFHEVIEEIKRSERIVVDTETTWTEFWHRRELMGIAILCIPGNRAFYLPYGHEHDATLFDHADNLDVETLKRLAEVVKDVEVIFHNAKFDLNVLRKVGVEFKGTLWDTMIMSYMVDENSTHALKLLANKIVSEGSNLTEKKLKSVSKKLGGWEKVPPVAMAVYAEKDVELTYKLWQHFLPLLEEQDLLKLWPTESDFIRCLADIEWEGIGLDTVRAMRLSQQAQARLKEIQDELGFDPKRASLLAHRLFASPPEGLGFLPGELSSERTSEFPHGIPIMDAESLSRYNHPIVELVLEHRKLVKADGTWYRGFLAVVDAHGRLHPNYKQHGTKTTRLSCEGPNMQQIPRNINRHPAKTLLIPRQGYQLWEFDYSQVEFRLAACYSKDENLIGAFCRNEDIHQFVADQIGITRQFAKTVNYLIIYGGGAGKLAQTLNRPLHECRSLLEEYHGRYPGLKRIAYEAQRAAEAVGYVKLWTGRRRHFQFEWEHHKAFNSVIQGGAAEIMKRSMLDFWHSDSPAILVSQVHDSLWFEIPEDRPELTIKEIIGVMEWPSEKFPVPFPVDTKHLN